MPQNKGLRIDIEAANALAEWKSRFAEEVCERAAELAIESNQPNKVTLSHYQLAAEAALRSLSQAIHRDRESHVQPDAA
jgi:hypothetical protein